MQLRIALERLSQPSVEMPWSIESNSISHRVMLTDPAGNLIEMVQFGR
jgi:hypothetical protein